MIVKEEFLGRLRKIFDLNLYEAKVWTALLSRGVSTAGELSNIGDVPRSRTYDILESLEKKGFVIMKLGKPIQFIALKPMDVIEKAKKNFQNEAVEKSKRLELLKNDDLLKEINSLYSTGIKFVQPHELSGALRGRTNLHNHLDMMVKNASKSVTMMTSAAGLTRKIESLKEALEKAHKKGVKIKIAAPINKKNIDAAKAVSKIAEVRATNDPKARFTIIDGKELMFMVLNDEEVHPSYDVGVWISTDYFANALDQLFDLAWQKMTPLSKVNVQ